MTKILYPVDSILVYAVSPDMSSDYSDSFQNFHSQHHQINRTQIREHIDRTRSEWLLGFPLQAEERVRQMVEREKEHLPRDDYLNRLRIGELDLSVRKEAFDWILKAYAHYNFGPMCVSLSMNYLDRFLSLCELPQGKEWATQLLGVACLSLAAKMEEPHVPYLVDLQVGEPKFVFDAKTIQRMELLVLGTLKWRMQSLTSCSFIDYYLSKINDDNYPSPSAISRSIQLIMSTVKGMDFLEFKPSEIAAAVAISVSGEIQALDIDKAMLCLHHLDKARVLKCVQLIRDLVLLGGSPNVAILSGSIFPESPTGVLDAANFSCKSDDIAAGSCANSSPQSTADVKGGKEDKPSEG